MAQEERYGSWNSTCKKFQIPQRWTEPYSYWQNKAETTVKEIKKGIKMHAWRRGSPKCLWCYLGKWVAAIRRFTAHDFFGLDDVVPEARHSGGEADISEYAQFDWYQCGRYMDPKQETHLGRWIGVAEDVGSPMTFWILPKSGIPIARSTVSALTEADMDSEAMNILHTGLIVWAERSLPASRLVGDTRIPSWLLAA